MSGRPATEQQQQDMQARDIHEQEEEEEDETPATSSTQPMSARERAERAAAAALARAGKAPEGGQQSTGEPATTTETTPSTTSQSHISNPAAGGSGLSPAVPVTFDAALTTGPAASTSSSTVSSQPGQLDSTTAAAPVSTSSAVDNLTQAVASTSLSGNPAASSTPNDLVKSLSEQLECSICREIVFQPVSVLDCLHTFCGSCLIQWVSTHPGEPECPTCRSPARATKDSHQHNSLRDVLIRMDPSQDRSEEEKAEMRRIYTPGSTIDLVQTSRMVDRNRTRPGQEGGNIQQEQQQQLVPGGGRQQYFAPPMRVIMNPIDELNLLLRYYFPCPTCEPGNPYRYLCERPIPDPRTIMVLGGMGGVRPIPRTEANMPQGHTQCFNCKRPNLMPLRDRRQYPQDVCAICSERFCQNLLGYCGPIKQPKARPFSKLDDFTMPPRQGLIASAFSGLFGTGSDPDSIGTFMPHLFGNDSERVRAFDTWLQKHKKMNLDDFYHAVIRHTIAQSPQPLVVGGDEQGLSRASWQGVPGRYMRHNIRRDDWVCVNCARDLVESHARDWYNTELQRDPPPANSLLFKRTAASTSSTTTSPSRGQQRPPGGSSTSSSGYQEAVGASSSGGGFFSSIKKGFNDLGDKFNDLTSDPTPTVPPPFPVPLEPVPRASDFPDRQLLKGNQLPKYPTHLATSRDTDGHPVFLAIFHHPSGAMLPGKICPNLRNPVRVAWEGKEYNLTKDDKYETFLENPEVHKWIRISNSTMPASEIPVAAGIERDGRTPLYFACAWHEGLRIPGYSGPNTMGARVPFGGAEVTVKEDYEVLVWRHNPDR